MVKYSGSPEVQKYSSTEVDLLKNVDFSMVEYMAFSPVYIYLPQSPVVHKCICDIFYY